MWPKPPSCGRREGLSNRGNMGIPPSPHESRRAEAVGPLEPGSRLPLTSGCHRSSTAMAAVEGLEAA